MEAAPSSAESINFYHVSRCHIREDLYVSVITVRTSEFTGIMWLRNGNIVGFFEHGNELSCSIRGRGTCDVMELLVSNLSKKGCDRYLYITPYILKHG
jgi:hypothetical protein